MFDKLVKNIFHQKEKKKSKKESEEKKEYDDVILYNTDIQNDHLDKPEQKDKEKEKKKKEESFSPDKIVLLKKKFIIKKENVLIGKRIGKGQYGEVRNGILKLSLGRKLPVAIKIINIGKANQEECEKEVLIMTKASNKHVVKVYGVFFDEEKAHIVMELCEQSLYHKLKNDDLTLKQKLNYLIQISNGMQYLHKNEIVHRDLKTQNILLGNDGKTLKITDFGTAKHFSSITGTLCGTIEYLAPEIYDLSLFKDPCLVDIYSFGIIIWEILNQTIPFRHTKKKFKNNQVRYLKEIMENRMRPSTRHLKKIPFLLIALMKKCWQQDPGKRPKSFKEIARILKKIRTKD